MSDENNILNRREHALQVARSFPTATYAFYLRECVRRDIKPVSREEFERIKAKETT